jgi:multidrug efflux pump subunit AcrA (membrane-fusion protein)/beta-lactamase regulating signal transducer with metallopeptidase domain
MTTILLLAEWAVRSSILILSGALLLWALRVKDSSIRLAAWTAMLYGSLAIPGLTAALPKMPVAEMRIAARPLEAPELAHGTPVVDHVPASRFEWERAALIVYALIAAALLLRIVVGLAMSLRLRRSSRATGQETEGIEIRESEYLSSPITLGIVRPAILLPVDWRDWNGAKLDAVLAHERSHIRRYDPAVQLLSAVHRALLWPSPLSWFLHQRLVRVAEEASDDAAALTCERALYAEVLLEFIGRGVRRASWLGVPMARYGSPIARVHRVLDAKSFSRGVTRWSVAAILALGLPLMYVVSARPVRAGQNAQVPFRETQGAKLVSPQIAAVASAARGEEYWNALGAVTAYTVTIKSRIDGQLMSVNFKEGDLVHAGQVLVSIDPRPYQLQLAQAEGQLAREQARLGDFNRVAEIQGSIKAEQAKVDQAKLQLTYTQIVSPITGVAGLLQVDPGNIVHASDTTGIVTINQLQPIAVLFSISEDKLPQMLARIRDGVSTPVEAWSRDFTVKYATGRLEGADNQVDMETSNVRLKAVFDNKDRALFPNQFVNVRVLVGAR